METEMEMEMEEASRFECTLLLGRAEEPAEEHLHDRYLPPLSPNPPPPPPAEAVNPNRASYFRLLPPDWLLFAIPEFDWLCHPESDGMLIENL